MASTLLELTRSSHEEVERLERLVVKDLQREPTSNRERLFQSHRVRNMIDRVIETTNKLVEIYEDKDRARKDEIAALGVKTAGSGGTSTLNYSGFYDRLKDIREYHRRNPSARIVDVNDDGEEILKEEPRIEFSGEESFGRYLDMHELYNEYVNSKFGEPIEYSAFLDAFSQTHKIPRHLKQMRQYKDYLEHLLEYLVSFFIRTQPLQDLDKIFSKLQTEFEELWAAKKVRGWENNDMENGHTSVQESVIDLDYYSSVEELIELGPQRLKEGLAALGLKTGGTVQQRAERLLLTKDTPLEQLDKKHFAKGSRSSGNNNAEQLNDSAKEVALMEFKIQKMCELLEETIVQTKENVEKKQALTYEEMEAEREEEEVQADTESDDEEQQMYNPLKLPMGWDGKPIPYWLYKLHGLGQEFKCEICGNHSYWGRRAFERHFKEWRHQHGMRCLNIPNTKNFNEITSIQEAKVLWERIQERQGVIKWRPDLEEEYEDREGNIYNKKTYTDLQRQGLI
ncbi:hypothetical protein QJS10_CPB12g01097 [Acorus calamus]|uniref:Matrin-type domain-containing protein n=1 Tax=Acorus calamus TaxID=4465 RepID=A0AAV9DR95_ACOCL|nr:hypothetical protein QJS10_CPB12g01097 [Acorus calamus]